MGLFKKNYIIGLDIGHSSIKSAQFIKKEGKLTLVKAYLKELSRTDDDNRRKAEIISVLKDIFSGADAKGAKVIVSVNSPDTMVRIGSAPYMPRSELNDAIRLEAKNYFPFPLDEAVLDFEILGIVAEKSVKKYQIMAATSSNKTVKEYLLLLNEADIKPVSLVPGSYALAKLIEALFNKSKNISAGVVKSFIDIGEQYTELIIFKGKDLLFSRKIPVSGIVFTKAMTGLLISDRGKIQLTFDEAEKIKRETGIPPADESKEIDNKIYTDQILSMIREPMDQLVNEIDRSFRYYREGFGGGSVDSVVLFGGGSRLTGLKEFLSGELGIPVEQGDFLEGVEFNPGTKSDLLLSDRPAGCQLAFALGAALSEGKGVNVLPVEIKENVKRIFRRAAVMSAAASAIIILAFLYQGLKIQAINFEKRAAVSNMELESLKPQLEKLEAQNMLTGILADKPDWVKVFTELSNIIPDNIYLREFSVKDKVITIKGAAGGDKKEAIFLDFMHNLEKGIFKDVKLVNTKEVEKEKTNDFELTCSVE